LLIISYIYKAALPFIYILAASILSILAAKLLYQQYKSMCVRNSFKLSCPLLYFSRAVICLYFLAVKSTYFLSSCVSILTYALSSSIFYSAVSLASAATVTARAISSFLRVAIINN
jgi:hypothetical protein